MKTHSGFMGRDLMLGRLAQLIDGCKAGQLPDVREVGARWVEVEGEEMALPYFFKKPVNIWVDWSAYNLAKKDVTWR
jgi:hypothetical protein